MSEAAPDICDADALLAEVAALDMALLRHVNAVALATTDPDTLNGLVRSQQRLARSVRTTLTTKAKLGREKSDARKPDVTAAGTRLPRMAWETGEETGEVGYAPERALAADVTPAIRLEYDPAEADAIEHELDDLIDEIWEADGYARRLPAERAARLMAHIRNTFGLSKTVTPPTAEAQPSPTLEAEAPPAPWPPEPSRPEPYIPPWERRPRHAVDKGGGSGW